MTMKLNKVEEIYCVCVSARNRFSLLEDWARELEPATRMGARVVAVNRSNYHYYYYYCGYMY